ncbi:MAG: hypothetical protein ABNG96_05885 [Flavobacterium sp.]|jgi:hypothetical protein
MNISSFKIRKSKIKSELAKIYKAHKGYSNKAVSRVLEITITDNLVTLVIPGVKLEIPCETLNTAKATLDFLYFYDIVKSWSETFIEVIFSDNQMQIGITKIKLQTTFFENDSILRSIKLPLNYTDWHLLQLEHKGYTLEELRFNKLEFEVYHANRRLTQNINKVINILVIYGFTKNEIKNLIESKVRLY